MNVWWVVITLGLVTILIRAMGTVALGKWRPSDRARRSLSLVAPTVLTALIVLQVFTTRHHYELDARAAGLGAAALAALLRAPLLAVVACAVAAADVSHLLLA